MLKRNPQVRADELLRERINYLPNERKNDLPQQVTKHNGRKTYVSGQHKIPPCGHFLTPLQRKRD